MYTKIVNPYTNRKVSIFSKQGKIVLRSYLDKQSSMKRGGKKALRGGYPLGPPPPPVPGGPNDPELYTERRPEEQLREQFTVAAAANAPVGHPLHNVAVLGPDIVARARDERLATEVSFMDYLIRFMAQRGLAPIQLAALQGPQHQATLIAVATREARRILNLLSETVWTGGSGIRNLQQYRDWLFAAGPHILARQGALSLEQVEIMRQHFNANPPL